MPQLYSITIHNKDLAIDHTESGLIEDKLAMACGQWTYEELTQANVDYSREGCDNRIKEFDYEMAFLNYLNSKDSISADARFFSHKLHPLHTTLMKEFRSSTIKLGAFIALYYDELFQEALAAYTDSVQVCAQSFYDNETELTSLNAHELYDDCVKAEADFWDDLHRNWLHGDRDSRGVYKEFFTWIGAESIETNLPKEEIILSFEHDTAVDLLRDKYGEEDTWSKVTAKNLKDYVIDCVDTANENNYNKQQAERAKRKQEYAKTTAYQDERKAQDQAQREAKLKAMKK